MGSLGSLRGLSGSFAAFVGFIRAGPGGRRVHSGSLGSFGPALAVLGVIMVRQARPWRGRVHWERPVGRRVHLSFFEHAFGVVGSLRSLPGDRGVHSGWLGTFGRALGVVGFIQVR